MGITVENLTKRYGPQLAVNQLSFTASQGGVLGFLGPNGAGKTTSLRMIAGLLRPDQGKVYYGDLDIWAHPAEARRSIGYLPETNPLYPDLYVYEILSFYAKIHNVSGSRVDAVIEQVGLGQESNKKIKQLSKGFRQRVGLGIAILHDPKILILDEPISGLDPNQLSGIRQLIRELAREKTILFSSHILSEVEQVCDRVLIIYKGELRVIDSLERLQAEQDGRQVIVAEVDSEVPAESLSAISTMDYCEKLAPGKLRLVAHPGADMRKDLYQWSVQAGVVLLESRVEQTSVASLFEKLTK
ncbi:ATP-binding cassette domain-containing protein [Membranicola marinus]|uniref:ATP-binding cassette domain-containing protein n=1 Tax=Membranihabitans marinus TaxID=1227546 RepID=A0A953HR70_9BACT|nr:ATP-binding cassette domain-containing protein [Membranihabitans marinus]MBY5959764.1 ATP-binding cassette domain-containing protein [Membranihabitans marinus]